MKKSPIHIVSIVLVSLEFKKINEKLRGTKVRPGSLSIDVSVLEVDRMTYSTSCKIGINEGKEKLSDYSFIAEYEITSKTLEEEFAKDAEGFAKLGAPFNVLVHVRELLQSLTARAFGRSVLLPLMDIRELMDIAKITMVIKQEVVNQAEVSQKENTREMQ